MDGNGEEVKVKRNYKWKSMMIGGKGEKGIVTIKKIGGRCDTKDKQIRNAKLKK